MPLVIGRLGKVFRPRMRAHLLDARKQQKRCQVKAIRLGYYHIYAVGLEMGIEDPKYLVPPPHIHASVRPSIPDYDFSNSMINIVID